MCRLSIGLLVVCALCTSSCAEDEPLSSVEPIGTAGIGGSGGATAEGGSGGVIWPGPNGVGGSEEEQTVFYQLSLEIEQGVSDLSGRYSRVVGSFSGSGLPLVPQLSHIENCEVCDTSAFEGYPSWTPTAGTITVRDKHKEAIVMEPQLRPGRLLAPQLYAYESPVDGVPRWEPLDRLAVYAEGADISPFQAGLVFPDAVKLVEPLPRKDKSSLPVVDRSDGVRLIWNPVDQQVAVSIIQYRRDALDRPAMRVRCVFFGEFGTGRISANILSRLDGDDMLSEDVSRTELVIAGMRAVQIASGQHAVLATLSNGRGHMVNVR